MIIIITIPYNMIMIIIIIIIIINDNNLLTFEPGHITTICYSSKSWDLDN